MKFEDIIPQNVAVYKSIVESIEEEKIITEEDKNIILKILKNKFKEGAFAEATDTQFIAGGIVANFVINKMNYLINIR